MDTYEKICGGEPTDSSDAAPKTEVKFTRSICLPTVKIKMTAFPG